MGDIVWSLVLVIGTFSYFINVLPEAINFVVVYKLVMCYVAIDWLYV